MKKLMTIVLGLILLVPIFVYGQGPGVQWAKKFGDLGDDWAYSVIRTSDGGFLIVGYTEIIGPDESDPGNVLIVKTDCDGNKMWTKNYGDQGLDKAYAVKETQDTCYICVGVASGTVYLLKLDADGNKVMAKTFNPGGFCEGRDVSVTEDGYVIVGTKGSHLLLMATDPLGNLLWTRDFGGTSTSRGYSLDQTADGGYIIAGCTDLGGSVDVYLIKCDSAGIETWHKTYGGLKVDKGYSVQQLSDGGYVIAGLANSFGADSLDDVYLVRTDPDGGEIWGWTYGNQGVDNQGYAVDLTADGGYIIAGCTYSTNGTTNDYDIYVARTDASGETTWTMTLGGPLDEYAYSLKSTTDGGYIIAGAIATDSAKFDAYLIKTRSEFGINENGKIAPFFSFNLNSNPVRTNVTFNLLLADEADVTLRIYDIAGRLIDTPISARLSAGSHAIPWIAKVNSGIYFYRFSSREQEKTGKIVFVR